MRKYNEAWAEGSGIPIKWIPDAGHNSNTDQPELVNRAIEDFLTSLSI